MTMFAVMLNNTAPVNSGGGLSLPVMLAIIGVLASVAFVLGVYLVFLLTRRKRELAVGDSIVDTMFYPAPNSAPSGIFLRARGLSGGFTRPHSLFATASRLTFPKRANPFRRGSTHTDWSRSSNQNDSDVDSEVQERPNGTGVSLEYNSY